MTLHTRSLALAMAVTALAGASTIDTASAQGTVFDLLNIDKPGRPNIGLGNQGGGKDDVSGFYGSTSFNRPQQPSRSLPGATRTLRPLQSNGGGTAVLEGTTPALKRRPNSASAQRANARGATVGIRATTERRASGMPADPARAWLQRPGSGPEPTTILLPPRDRSTTTSRPNSGDMRRTSGGTRIQSFIPRPSGLPVLQRSSRF
jgi:hypothetical protein